MYCPKCGTENSNDSKSCRSCGQELTSSSPKASVEDAKTNNLAIWALILGILSIVLFRPLMILGRMIVISPLMAIIALILGINSLDSIKRNEGQLKGRGLAIAGIVISIMWLAILSTQIILKPRPPHGKDIKEKAQFHSIGVAIKLFNNGFGAYPPSDALDPTGQAYGGAMKLCEAMMGQDLQGFHPDSLFRVDGDNGSDKNLYDEGDWTPQESDENLKRRRGPFLVFETANLYQLKDVYEDVGPFDGNSFIMCDVYTRGLDSKRISGMPVLYYRANTSRTAHDVTNPDNPENIYNYKDNHALVGLGVPWEPGKQHPLFTNPRIFYEMTKNKKVTTKSVPQRADSYILISAGYDGLYGTRDDIVNFDR